MADHDRETIDEMLSEAKKDLDEEQADHAKKQHERHLFRGGSTWLQRRKLLAVLVIAILMIIAALAVPSIRYKLAGIVIDRDMTLHIVDNQTGQAVSGADVSVQGKTFKTNGTGDILIRAVKPGRVRIQVSKKYYQDSHAVATVGIQPITYTQSIKLIATGRQVPVRITNKITGAGVAAVKIVTGGVDAETNQNGEATVVVDAAATTLPAQLSADAYNQTQVNLTVTQEVTANSFTMTPIGTVYFLSKKSGNIDVVKANLDGTERTVIVPGTGNEEDTKTVLSASSDWKFLALLTRRDGNHATLYLIDTSADKLTQIDSQDAVFTMVGWSGHSFVYLASDNTKQNWQVGQTQLKSFNADTGALKKVDETSASGSGYDNYAAESFGEVRLIKHDIVYIKNWAGTSKDVRRKHSGLYVSASDNPSKQTVKDFDQSYLTLAQPNPAELYIQQIKDDNTTSFFIYRDAQLENNATVTSAMFNRHYASYILSPDENKTLWYEQQDGKISIFVGDKNGAAGHMILGNDQYLPVGWYNDEYILLTKNNSELYIVPNDKATEPTAFQKIADYHASTIQPRLSGGSYGAR